MSSFTRPALNGMCPLCPNQCTSSTRESHEQPMCILMFSVAANSGGALKLCFCWPVEGIHIGSCRQRMEALLQLVTTQR